MEGDGMAYSQGRVRVQAFVAMVLMMLVVLSACSSNGSEGWHVTFLSDGEVVEVVDVSASQSGSSCTAPSVEKEGYVISGWKTDSPESEGKAKKANGFGNSYIVTVYADDAIFEAEWAKGCIVSFVDEQGEELEKVTVAKGSSMPAVVTPTRDGYKFAGWEPSPESIDKDITVTATWIEIEYFTVDFTDGLGNVLKSETVEAGEAATAPSSPTRDGYTFDGWDASFSNVSENMTVNAKWKIKPTVAMQNAASKAKSYLSHSAFSYSGLIEQLEYEKFTHDEAVYGVDNCGADWNEQAAKKAKSYLSHSSFSRDGLIEQLEYEGFTYDQAVYGVNAVGL